MVGPSKMPRTLDRSRRMLSSTWSLITSASGFGMNVVTNCSRCSSVTLMRASSFASSTNAVVACDQLRLVHPDGQVADGTALHGASRPVVQLGALAQGLEQLVADDVLNDLVASPGDVQDVARIRASERLPTAHLRERGDRLSGLVRRVLLPQVHVALLDREPVSRVVD